MSRCVFGRLRLQQHRCENLKFHMQLLLHIQLSVYSCAEVELPTGTYELANVHDKFLLEAHADRTAPHHRSCSHETGLACKTSRLVRPTSSETSVKYYMRLAQCKKHYKLTLLKRRLWSNGHGVSYFQGN